MSENSTKVKQIYGKNAMDELDSNKKTVKKMLAKIEDVLTENHLMSGQNSSRISEQLHEEIRQRVLKNIAQGRVESSEEIASAIEKKLDRELQKDEEKAKGKSIIIRTEEVFEDLIKRLGKVLEQSQSRYAEDARYYAKRILTEGKDSIIETHIQYTNHIQAEIDSKVMEEIDAKAKTVMNDFCKDLVIPTEEMSSDNPYCENPESKNVNKNKEAFHNGQNNGVKDELDTSWLK